MADEGDIIDAITWISRNDWERAKEKAYTFSSSITAIKYDMTLLKAELAGVAAFSAGLGLVKLDYTFLKVDEKGISWRGRQIYSTRFADEVKHYQTQLDRKQLEFAKKMSALETAQATAARKRTDLDAATARLESARTSSRRPNSTSADFTELARSADAQRDARRAYDRAEAEVSALHDKVTALKTKVGRISNEVKEVKPDAIFEKATEALERFEEALHNTAAQA
ncbi:hypothetical protein ABZT04_14450 [Streptomyces sp. NPDC005492]|uniref:hypothetical protein n=1 Tax=Streptomyces sp. NPDC005492 TaxID=3156883 RepID=UPI0033A735EE